MKVLGLSGSMRREGNTAQLIRVILQRCEDAGIRTEFVSLAGKKITPCLGCEKCKEKASAVAAAALDPPLDVGDAVAAVVGICDIGYPGCKALNDPSTVFQVPVGRRGRLHDVCPACLEANIASGKWRKRDA